MKETRIHRNTSTLPAALIRHRLEFVELITAPHEPGRSDRTKLPLHHPCNIAAIGSVQFLDRKSVV